MAGATRAGEGGGEGAGAAASSSSSCSSSGSDAGIEEAAAQRTLGIAMYLVFFDLFCSSHTLCASMLDLA